MDNSPFAEPVVQSLQSEKPTMEKQKSQIPINKFTYSHMFEAIRFRKKQYL